MKASLALEAIGQNYTREIRDMDRYIGTATGCRPDLMPWRWGVWQVGFKKPTILHGKWDYTNANGKGSRGVYVHYLLESGHLYQVAEPTSWKSTNHYFCTVNNDGDIIQMNQEEGYEWLQNNR